MLLSMPLSPLFLISNILSDIRTEYPRWVGAVKANETRSDSVVGAELDWREWTHPDDEKREAVTFRACQVLFEGADPHQLQLRTVRSRTTPVPGRQRMPTANRGRRGDRDRGVGQRDDLPL